MFKKQDLIRIRTQFLKILELSEKPNQAPGAQKIRKIRKQGYKI